MAKSAIKSSPQSKRGSKTSTNKCFSFLTLVSSVLKLLCNSYPYQEVAYIGLAVPTKTTESLL